MVVVFIWWLKTNKIKSSENCDAMRARWGCEWMDECMYVWMDGWMREQIWRLEKGGEGQRATREKVIKQRER